jgi:hypothetical protein
MLKTLRNALDNTLWSAALALCLILLATPDYISPADVFDTRLSAVAAGQRFDLISWIVGAFAGKVRDRVEGVAANLDEPSRDAMIARYFQLAREEEDLRNRIVQRKSQAAAAEELAGLEDQRSARRADKLALQSQVETIIAQRVEHASQAEGLALDLPLNPQIVVPPVAFSYVTPPLLLVMSPHDKIVQQATVHLLADMTLAEIEATEAAADRLGVVSLIVPIGGVGTYPTMVLENSSYDVSLEIVSHEWTHNYLDVRPLGMHYADNGEMTTINETTANISGHELANLVRGQPAPTYEDDTTPLPNPAPGKPVEFDFNREMRATRLAVDEMLKAGDVAGAEAYMEERRKLFVAHGYALRKLNQAYFAFYGSYADGGVGTVNPIGGELMRLRRESGSLKNYLTAIANISSFEEYRALLKAKGIPEGKR